MILGDLTIVLGLLACLEFVLRAAAPIYGKQVFDNEYTGSHLREMNPQGYRGTLVSQDKKPGELRVLGVGDSVTFGSGVATNSTWTSRLESALRQRTSRPVVAINVGLESASIEDLVRAWNEQWVRFRADVVVLALTGNMVGLEVARPGQTYLPTERYDDLHQKLSRARQLALIAGRAMHHFNVPSFASLESQHLLYWDGLLTHKIESAYPIGVLLAHGFRQGDIDPTLAETAWARFEGFVREFADRVNASGATLLITYVPPRFLLSGDLWDNPKNVPVERFSIDPLARVARISEDLHVGYVDALAALRLGREKAARSGSVRLPMYIFFDYQHLSEDGHGALAGAIAAEVPLGAGPEQAAIGGRSLRRGTTLP
jgi:lysophospholipase L1-like esterase